MLPKVFVDGQEGTTGLRIHEYLAGRTDLEVLRIDPGKRRDVEERRRLINAANVVFLCLPDTAAREAVTLVDNPDTRVIDASTAHRTDPAWAFGLPELTAGQRERIRTSKRVANPGCHATGYLLAVRPLVDAGLLAPDAALACSSLTGYSGGGKKMIADYEAVERHDARLGSPRPYALGLTHKHLPEMQAWGGLNVAPVFTPVVCNVHSGMAVEVFLPASHLAKKAGPADLHQALAAHFADEPFIRVMPLNSEAHLDGGFFDMTACNLTNRADVFVFGHEEQMAIIVRLDNLGKGASGAAVQNMNLMLGMEETAGLSAEPRA